MIMLLLPDSWLLAEQLATPSTWLHMGTSAFNSLPPSCFSSPVR